MNIRLDENMQPGPGVKKKILKYFLFTILFFVTALSFHYFSELRENNLSSRQRKTERVLRDKEKILDRIMQKIVLLGDSVTFPGLHALVPANLWERDGIVLFAFQEDSLIYWSDNSVPAIPPESIQEFDKPFVKYGNGWFNMVRAENGNLKILGLILVKNQYPYQNEFLKNDFQKDFHIPEEITLDTIPGMANITDTRGTFLFSLDIPATWGHEDHYDIVVFICLLASFIFFILLLFYLYHLFDFLRSRPVLLFLAFLMDTILLRLLLMMFKIPGFLYDGILFSPYYFATSFISPSLGDLVINSFIWLTLAWLFYAKVKIDLAPRKKYSKYITASAMIIASGILFYLLMSTMRRMIIDSSFELNLNNIFNIDILSGFAFIAYTALLFSFFLVTAKLSVAVCRSGINRWTYILIVLIVSGLLFPLLKGLGPVYFQLTYSLVFFVYLISFIYFSHKASGYKSIAGVLFYIFLFSLVSTFTLDFYHYKKEREKRKILANELSSKRDPMMEFEFNRLNGELLADSTMERMIRKRRSDKSYEDSITSYLKKNYLNSLWGNYEQLITICSKGEILEIQPSGYLVDCYDYFNNILISNKADTVAKGLYFFNNRSENNNYLAIFDFYDDSSDLRAGTRIFVELYYKYIKETGLGYPDLLIDKKVKMISGLSNYSYSRYFEGSLVYKYGDFSYHLSFSPYFKEDGTSYFVDTDGYDHFVTRLDEDNVLIISKKTPGILDLIAPFSYLFILFGLFLLVFLFLVVIRGNLRRIEFNFSNQLQLSVILIIIISFFILGVITRTRIIHLNNDKNVDMLSEKTFSVLTELEHKIGTEQEVDEDMVNYLGDLLLKFSTIFYSDINLYDPQGNLIVSSRPQIFEEGLLSAKMNTEAFQRLAFEQNLLFIQNEKIGLQEYLSAYIPFRNTNDKIIAYLNLPYFAKQTEIRKEISDFLVAYINVYVLLIVLAIMVTIIVSRLVTRPLQLIKESLGRVELGKANARIEWSRKDEIGGLIEEYNRMVEELARSAELLASSERESAWREMAKQVAHEIKNPLTPMKLSVQYLKKAWDEKAPDWEKRLDRFTRTIIEQIESLSQIASEFSDFAKMPKANLEKIELTSVVKDAVNLYHDIDNLRFTEYFQEDVHYILADKRQILRVFNNLIQNAVQAIGSKDDGRIGIKVTHTDGYQVVELSDNGSGITEELAGRIFVPSFTTKSSGMGLGLAMVKSILTSIGGTVSFTSKEGEGTTFVLKIPEYKEQ